MKDYSTKLAVNYKLSKRKPQILFDDILNSINQIEEYCKGIDFEKFNNNRLIIDAVVRNIEIIGEASARIPENVQHKFSSIQWNQLRGIRNRIVHEYFDVDVSIIWFIIENELGPLKKKVEAALKILSDG